MPPTAENSFAHGCLCCASKCRCRVFAASGEFFPLQFSWSTESESVYYEGIVVLFFPLLVGPVIRAYPCMHDQLVAPAPMLCNGLCGRPERNEPKTRGQFEHFARVVPTGEVVSDQAEA